MKELARRDMVLCVICGLAAGVSTVMGDADFESIGALFYGFAVIFAVYGLVLGIRSSLLLSVSVSTEEEKHG